MKYISGITFATHACKIGPIAGLYQFQALNSIGYSYQLSDHIVHNVDN